MGVLNWDGGARPSCILGCLFVLVTSTLAATPQVARDSITTVDLKRHVAFLASDTLEGRAAGSQGGRAAAAYLAQQFREAGLQPGVAGNDFLQPFDAGSQNLLAILPGSDPDLRNEVIVISGHFDHVGFGNSGNSFGQVGQIHNGADDNASGTAAILEVARAMASLDQSPRRTILFALWDAEEGGMIGSTYWLNHPTLDGGRIRFMVNCDMVGRLRNNVLHIYGCRSAGGLRQRLAEANVATSLLLNLEWRQRDDSDHWPFYKRGIPYVMLHTGDHLDYHRPSDDVEKVNYAGLQSVSRMLFEFTRGLADANSAPTFRAASRQERRWQQQQAEAIPQPPPPRLGLSTSENRQPGEPFVVTRVETGSPAAIAGIQVGDELISFDGRSAADVATLVEFVLPARRQTTAIVKRSGHQEQLTLNVTMRGNPVRIGVSWRLDDAEPGVAIVTSVVPGSPASSADIQPLDRLLPPAEVSTIGTEWLKRAATQQQVTLRRERRGQLMEIPISPLRPAAAP